MLRQMRPKNTLISVPCSSACYLCYWSWLHILFWFYLTVYQRCVTLRERDECVHVCTCTCRCVLFSLLKCFCNLRGPYLRSALLSFSWFRWWTYQHQQRSLKQTEHGLFSSLSSTASTLMSLMQWQAEKASIVLFPQTMRKSEGR